jgi:hypothetical protein
MPLNSLSQCERVLGLCRSAAHRPPIGRHRADAEQPSTFGGR